MGIYIKGIKMPKVGELLAIEILPDGKVSYHLDLKSREIAAAISVPPHGRLIDADALKPYMLNEHYKHRLVYDANEVANAPTIVPAEPPKEEV